MTQAARSERNQNDPGTPEIEYGKNLLAKAISFLQGLSYLTRRRGPSSEIIYAGADLHRSSVARQRTCLGFEDGPRFRESESSG